MARLVETRSARARVQALELMQKAEGDSHAHM